MLARASLIVVLCSGVAACEAPCEGPDFDVTGTTFATVTTCDLEGKLESTQGSYTLVPNERRHGFTFDSGKASGMFCGRTFTWRGGNQMATELGWWEFSDARTFTGRATYEVSAGSPLTGDVRFFTARCGISGIAAVAP